MTIEYRPARRDDLHLAMDVVTDALNDLERRHGFDGVTAPLDTSFAEFCLADDPSGLWVAEEGREISGFGFSWFADDFWYLAQLFVRPRGQQAGIGRALLERTLRQAEGRKCTCLALITFAYNRASLALYMRHGLFPRVPLYEVAGKIQMPIEPQVGENLTHDVVSGDETRIADFDRIDRQVLGLSRAKHHRFSLRLPSLQALLFRSQKGDTVGYTYVSKSGVIGPVAVTDAKYVSVAIAAAYTLAGKAGCERVSALLPGCCGEALSVALRSGLRLGRTMVFMSSRPLGDWERYAPRGPGYM